MGENGEWVPQNWFSKTGTGRWKAGGGEGGINYVCSDVSHQSELKLLFGNGCVREEARISPPFLVQTVE